MCHVTWGRGLSDVGGCFSRVTVAVSNHGAAWRQLVYFKRQRCNLETFASTTTTKTTRCWETWRKYTTTFDEGDRKMAQTCRKMKRQHIDARLSPTNTRNLLVLDEEYQNTWGVIFRNITAIVQEERRENGYDRWRGEGFRTDGDGEVRLREDGASALDQTDAHRTVGTASAAGTGHLLHLHVR